MSSNERIPPLKPLHTEESLFESKLMGFDRLSTAKLLESLALGCRECLKTRPDGTIIDGHHRIHVLRLRGVNVDAFPREVIEKEEF